MCCLTTSTSPSSRNTCAGFQTFITSTIATRAAIAARMAATSGPIVLLTRISTPAKASEQAAMGGSTSAERFTPDMTTTM